MKTFRRRLLDESSSTGTGTPETGEPILTVNKRPTDALGSVHIGSANSNITSSGFTEGTSVNLYALNEHPQYVIQWEHGSEVFPAKLLQTAPYPAHLNIKMPNESTTYTAYISNLIAEQLVLNVFVGYQTINGKESYFFKFLYELEGASEAIKRLYYLNDTNNSSFDVSESKDPELNIAKSNVTGDGRVIFNVGSTYDANAGNAGTDTTFYKTWYMTESDLMGATRPSIEMPVIFIPTTMGTLAYRYELLYRKLDIKWWCAQNGYNQQEEGYYTSRTSFTSIYLDNSTLSPAVECAFYLFYNGGGYPATTPKSFPSPENIKSTKLEFKSVTTSTFSSLLNDIRMKATIW